MRNNFYFDSGIFITPILKNRESRVIEECQSWQRRIMDGSIRAFTSFLTWDEFVYVVRKQAGKETAARIGRAFLSLPGLVFLPADEPTIRKAQFLLERCGSKPRDSIHASAAILHANGKIVTLDVVKSDFRKIGSEGEHLEIVEIS